MKWFKHFSDSHNNNSLTKVRMKYGADGYAIYWYCLELISGDLGSGETITFELKHDAEVIGYNLKIDQIRVQEIMIYMVEIGLFDNTEGTITCLKLAKYLDKRTTRNKTIHDIIDTATRLQTVSDCLGQSDNSQQTVSKLSPLDTDTDIDIEKNKHMLNSDEVEPDLLFTEFWILYPRKVGKKKSETSWNRLTKTKKRAAYAHLKGKPFSDTVEKFIPYPTSYINGESWDDVIPTGSQGTNWWEGGSI